MKALANILGDPSISGMFRSSQASAPKDLERLAADHGFTLFHVEGGTADSKDGFLELMSKALNFPDYFGMNWDAFEDCLTDMVSHEEAGGYLILYKGFETFAEKEPEDFSTALEIFKDATSFWSEQGKRMVVVLLGRPDDEWDIPEIGL